MRASTGLRAIYEDHKSVIANGLPIAEGKSEILIHPLIIGY
jgi:hypothetical protein